MGRTLINRSQLLTCVLVAANICFGYDDFWSRVGNGGDDVASTGGTQPVQVVPPPPPPPQSPPLPPPPSPPQLQQQAIVHFNSDSATGVSATPPRGGGPPATLPSARGQQRHSPVQAALTPQQRQECVERAQRFSNIAPELDVAREKAELREQLREACCWGDLLDGVDIYVIETAQRKGRVHEQCAQFGLATARVHSVEAITPDTPSMAANVSQHARFCAQSGGREYQVARPKVIAGTLSHLRALKQACDVPSAERKK
jgi:hypothetical protein